MKKGNHSSKKVKQNAAVCPEKHSQKKISGYFVKTSRNEDSAISDNVKDNETSNEGKCRKRKPTENVESLGSFKILKHNTFNPNGLVDVQQQEHLVVDEFDAVRNSFNAVRSSFKDNSTTTSERNISVEKCEHKEDIDVDKRRQVLQERNENKIGSLSTQSIKNTVASNSSNSNNSFGSKGDKSCSVENEQKDASMCNDVNWEEFDELNMLGTNITDDFRNCFEEEWSADNQINFNSLQRCKVINIQRESKCLLLTVQQEDYPSSTTVMCSGFWSNAKVEKDDIVAIQARKETQYWVVDNSSGFLVVHPDVLISGTTIVGSLFCSRKAIFTEKFRKMETLPYYQGDQTAMVIGNLAHQLLQKAIQQDIRKSLDIEKLMNRLLQSRDTTNVLYVSNMTFDKCKEEMLVFVPKIFEFIQHYLKDKKQQSISNMKNNFQGSIAHVHDIEESIWLPNLGIKGRVDITSEVNIHSRKKMMPLEVKTGRPSFSLEHRGQIILYIMMMALTGQDTDTGLLLYLRENNMQEIKGGHPEKRDLILLRNTLAHYFVPKNFDLSSGLNYEMFELPEPINHPTACAKCSYNALCCAYLSKDANVQLSESHPLMQLSKQILDKFKQTHIDYILKWISLLEMEESAQSSVNITKYLWTLSPEKREAKKTCISNLKIIGKVIELDSKYQHIFVRANVDSHNVNIPYSEFTENEYILVSTHSRINISAGFILNIKEDSVTVLLDRNITKYNFSETFHIDKYSSSSFCSSNLANVGGLMGDDDICAKLRDIVIDRKPATFAEKPSQSVARKSIKIINGLNENQQKAILKATTANDYILIKGMPGTGKTQTLVALIELLREMKCSILITAHTNSAVDNILLKLLDKGIDFIRLGSSAHSVLKHKTEVYVTANCHSPESLEAVYSSKNIVGVTCHGAHHALLGKRTFDVCIVDESTQVWQPTVLRPLYSARKFVLVGDPEQLPPIVKSKLAGKLGADETLFRRLDNENNTVILTKQYRMNKNIMQLANKLTYNDALEAGNTMIENATLNILHGENLMDQEKWIRKVLSQNISDSVIVLNTGCTSDLKVSSECFDKYPQCDQVYSNIWEAAIILKLLETLVKMDVKPQNIGIIAPYRAHVTLLKELVYKDVEVNTVDQYQGRDKDIIIFSCARSITNASDIKEDVQVLGDHRRLTVAITRAKHKLIVIADKCTLSQYSPFRKLFNLVEAKNIISLRDGHDDFSWKSIMSLLK